MHGLHLLLFLNPLECRAAIGRCVMNNDCQRISLGERIRKWNGQGATHNLMVVP